MVGSASHKADLRSMLRKQKIATLEELKRAAGTSATMTIFRRLKELEYRTSYSHRGKYYTLAKTPKFDATTGLWSCRSVWFSQHGNLLETTKELVQESEAGFTARELQDLLHVEVKQALLQLVREKQIHREKVAGVYVYLSEEKRQRKRQELLRRELDEDFLIDTPLDDELSQELNAAIILFCSLLDEKQRRLYAGLEAFKLGYGGDRKVAEFLGLNAHTVARGRRELFGGEAQQKGVRRKGAGRRGAKKKRRR